MLRTYENINLLIGVTHEIMKSIYHNDTTIPIHIIKIIRQVAQNHLIASGDMFQVTEVQIDTEIIHTAVMIVYAYQVANALEKDFQVGVININALTHPYAMCHILDVRTYNIHLQIANLPHCWDKSKRT